MARMRKTTTELSIYYQPYILIGMNRHVPYCVRIRIDEEARNISSGPPVFVIRERINIRYCFRYWA